jgi:hypothetical protein
MFHKRNIIYTKKSEGKEYLNKSEQKRAPVVSHIAIYDKGQTI